MRKVSFTAIYNRQISLSPDSGMVKILDFGLAKLVQGDKSSAEEGKGDTTPLPIPQHWRR